MGNPRLERGQLVQMTKRLQRTSHSHYEQHFAAEVDYFCDQVLRWLMNPDEYRAHVEEVPPYDR